MAPTDHEMWVIEKMWANGVPVTTIANSLGYSPYRVSEIIRSNRLRFPVRGRVSARMRDESVAMILSKRSSIKHEAERLGVHAETVRRWVHDAKARLDGRGGEAQGD